MHDLNETPGARRQGRRTIQRRASRVILVDPTETFLRQNAVDYEAFERHTYADVSPPKSKCEHTTSGFRGDTSSDEAFNPLNIGLRRR